MLVASLAIGLCLVLAWRYHKSQPLITFAIGWFFVTLLPFTNLIPSACAVCERYTYTAVYSFVFLLALFLWWLYHKKPLGSPISQIMSVTLSVSILTIYGYTSYQRNQDWKNPITIWQVTTEQSPQNSGVWYKLGVAYQNADRFDDAIKAYERTLSLTPEFALAHHNLGIIFESRGQIEPALFHYQKTVALTPNYWQGWSSLAAFYQRQNQPERAIEYYYEVLKIMPNQPTAVDNIHFLLEKSVLESKTEAEREKLTSLINQTLIYLPQDAMLWNNLGTVYAQQKRYDDARLAYEKALSIQPDFEAAKKNLDVIHNINIKMQNAK